MNQVPFDISPNQQIFLFSKKRIVIFRGGIRSGKTAVLCLKAIQSAVAGRRFAVISFSYPSLRDVAIFTTLKLLDKLKIPYVEQKSENNIIVANTPILFRSADKPDSLRGLGLHDFGIDEAREFHGDYTAVDHVWTIMIGRLSESTDGQAYIATTPKGNNWVSKLAKDKADICEMITQKTEDNPFISREYKEMLRSMYSSKVAAQELDAQELEFGAGIISSSWFKIVNPVPCSGAVRFWDVAVSIETSADFSAGAKMSTSNGRYALHNMKHYKLSYPDLKKKIIETAFVDGIDVSIYVEEAGQQKGFVDDLRRTPELSNHVIQGIRPLTDKLNRAMPWIARAEQGLVDVEAGAWNNSFFDECNSFTADDSHSHDDQIDAVSGAYCALGYTGSLIFTTRQLEKEKIQELTKEENTGFAKAFFPGVPIQNLFQ